MLHSLLRINPNFAARNLVGVRFVVQRAEGLSTLKHVSRITAGKVGKSAAGLRPKLSVPATRSKPKSNKVDSVSTKKYADGYVYAGSWQDDKWVGKGKLTSAAGQVWEGEFKEGKIYKGTGSIVFPNDDVYEGKWIKGQMEGRGQWMQANGSYLKGEFKNDTFYKGIGVLVHTDGTVSKGTWVGGRLEGEFTKHQSLSEVCDTASSKASIPKAQPNNYKEVVNPDGSVLRGEFKQNKIYNGNGVLLSPDGTSFEATWIQGKVQGQAKVTYINGNIYEGELIINQRHGYGVMSYPSGLVYEGMWDKGKRHGKGRQTNADGFTVEGEFRSNLVYNGSGKYVNSSGAIYEGTWVKGILMGKRTSSTGQVVEGEFRGIEIYNGKGVIVFSSGTVREGTWVKGKMEGPGKQTNVDGTALDGEWRADKIYNASGVLLLRDGSRFEGTWVEGNWEGYGKQTSPDGTVLVEGEWKAGRLVGTSGEVLTEDGKVLLSEVKVSDNHAPQLHAE